MRCNKCIEFQTQISAFTGEMQRELIYLRDRHRKLQMAHREEYRHNRQKAALKQNRDKDMSVIVDGAGGTGTTCHAHMVVQAKMSWSGHSYCM